jgi:hypothetical protein
MISTLPNIRKYLICRGKRMSEWEGIYNWDTEHALDSYYKLTRGDKMVVDTMVVKCVFKMSLWSVIKLRLLGIYKKQVSTRQQMIDSGIWDETHA